MPSNKSQRSNDFFFPQPPWPQMPNFPNYNPYNYPSYPNQLFDPMEMQMKKFLELELMKRKLERPTYKPKDKYQPMRQLLKTVEEIQEVRSRGTPNIYQAEYDNDRYKSPLRSEYFYKNILNNRPDSYQKYKNDKIGNFEVKDFFLPNNKKY